MRLKSKTRFSIFFLLFVFFFHNLLVYAQDVILLKSGEKVSGKILSRDGKSIVLDSGIGVGITYYADDIISINQQSFVSSGHVADTQSVMPAEDGDKLIQELIESAGLKSECNDMSANAIFILAASACPTVSSKQECAKVVRSIAPKPDLFYKSLVIHFKNNFNQSRLMTSLQFFNSPLGKKVVRAEEESNTAEAQKDEDNFIKQLQSNPPTQRRMALYDRYNTVTHEAELEINNTRAMNSLSPGDDQTVDIEQSKKDTQNDFVYTYRNITDEELNQYICFMETDAGKWYETIVKPWEVGTVLQTVHEFIKNEKNIGKSG